MNDRNGGIFRPLKHFYQSIPGWFRFQQVYLDAVSEAPLEGARFVEVGSWKGKSTAFMAVEIANSRKRIDFFAVDHWKGSDEPAHRADPDVRNGTLFETFTRNLRPASRFVIPLRMASVDAAASFHDDSLDFVLLDGDHTYGGMKDDLDAWLPKLKAGAVIAGDDWNWSGVNHAVRERFTGAHAYRELDIEVLGEGKGRHWRVRL